MVMKPTKCRMTAKCILRWSRAKLWAKHFCALFTLIDPLVNNQANCMLRQNKFFKKETDFKSRALTAGKLVGRYTDAVTKLSRK